MRSHSTAVPGQEMDTCPNVAQRSWLQVWMDIQGLFEFTLNHSSLKINLEVMLFTSPLLLATKK